LEILKKLLVVPTKSGSPVSRSRMRDISSWKY